MRSAQGRSPFTQRLMSAKRLALVAIVLVGVAYATMFQNWSDNQTSHYDLIRALVRRPHDDRQRALPD